MKLKRTDVQADIEALVARVIRGPGRVEPSARQAAVEGRPAGPLAGYLDKVRYAPTSITDEEVAALLAAGHSDDEIFELTVASALGASLERFEAGLAAVAAAYEEG